MKNLFNVAIILVIAVFAISTVFTSCKPDDENGKVQLVKTITYYDGKSTFYRNYEYDKKKRITSISGYYEGGEVTDIITLMYSGDDLVRLTYIIGDELDLLVNFTKKGNKITATFGFGEGIYGVAELNSDGEPIVMEVFEKSVNFQYFDGNLLKADHHDDFVITYKYDNKKSPFYNCKTPKWLPICYDYGLPHILAMKNNVIEYSAGESWEEFIYEYDNNGFPTEMYYHLKYNYMFPNERTGLLTFTY